MTPEGKFEVGDKVLPTEAVLKRFSTWFTSGKVYELSCNDNRAWFPAPAVWSDDGQEWVMANAPWGKDYFVLVEDVRKPKKRRIFA